jgi:hypothetical protein
MQFREMISKEMKHSETTELQVTDSTANFEAYLMMISASQMHYVGET